MKIIRDIELALDADEALLYPKMYRSDFLFQTRFIGNYLRRQFKLSNFEPKGYQRLMITACLNEPPPAKIFNGWLFVYIPFEKSKYEALSKKELPDFFIKMLIGGINKAKMTHDVPDEFLIEKLIEFKAADYVNEWEFKSKSFKEIGIKATLDCKMTIDAFSLSLTLSKNKEVVFSKEILKTSPDETCYHYQFKDLAFENNKIIVSGWYDSPPVYELDLSFKA